MIQVSIGLLVNQKIPSRKMQVGQVGCESEAPRGIRLRRASARQEPRGSLLRRSNASGCEGWIFAEPCEANNAIHPCGKPQGFLAKKGNSDESLSGFFDAGKVTDRRKRATRRRVITRT